MKQVSIFREEKRYGGWPANYGIWHWGDEIVLGFTRGYHDLRVSPCTPAIPPARLSMFRRAVPTVA